MTMAWMAGGYAIDKGVAFARPCVKEPLVKR